ncbi:MAG: LON peptidase substrate-binding domain-containing protein [Gemmatimonadetes bacterium]|nr:LON peptidase substrate-binding domain-containing protein [Gemmatimonadota bacterium]
MPLLQLPIFPLPLVLFPGVPQLLHIFEPRYRQMLSDCLQGDRRFGLSTVESDTPGDSGPARGTVGCVAYVQARTSMPDGRSNILAVGEDRYVLLDYVETDRLYRVARVDTFDDDPENLDGLAEASARVGDIFLRFSTVMNALNDAATSAPELADDPKARSFQISSAIEMEPRVKQELLRLRSIRRRLEALERVLRAAITELGPRAEVHVRARRNGKGGANPAIVQGPQGS